MFFGKIQLGVLLSFLIVQCSCFTPGLVGKERRVVKVLSAMDSVLDVENRRGFLMKIGTVPIISAVTSTSPAVAEDYTDLTSKMFNDDGSLKQEMETEAKFRKVELNWDVSDGFTMAVDGVNVGGTEKGSSIVLGYELPEKWGDGAELYVDKSEGVNQKACEKITVYQAQGKATIDRLEKATRVGIAKSLDVAPELSAIKSADLIGGRTSKRDGQKYFEFDMAVAPKTCENSAENLGLGFCPYDSIYLIAATVLNEKLYVFVAECEKAEWKRANADLRRVRSSFQVAQA